MTYHRDHTNQYEEKIHRLHILVSYKIWQKKD